MTVCARWTPASSRLCTRSTGPTKNTVRVALNVSTTLNGGAVLESTMMGGWLGRKGCRSVRKKTTTCCQPAPLATTSVTRHGSDRKSCASRTSRERASRSTVCSCSSSPKFEFSLTARWNFTVLVRTLRGLLPATASPLSMFSSCFKFDSCTIRLFDPYKACSRRCKKAILQSTEAFVNLEHTSLLQAIAMTTWPFSRVPSKLSTKQPLCWAAITRAAPSDSS
mmetsp:Transcript_82142/g.232603  ORF Transcript_82142/g.232603 Transcript_82142/m.232603 type:complete len:223 (+) Transcript_82142:1400-2068(+)